MKRSLTFVCLLTLIIGCQRAPAQTADATAASAQAGDAAQEQPASEPAKPVPTVLPAVLARVNGEAIEKDEFERALQNVEARAGQPVPAEQRDEVLRGVLDQLVSFRLLLQESRNRKIQVTDAELETRVGEIKKQFPSEADFQKALASRNMTLEALKQEARQEMTLSRLVDVEIKPNIKVEEAQVKDFYDKNPDRFQQPEAVRASHILVRVEDTATEAQKKEARTKVEGLLAKIKAGADFATLAREHSEDSSSAQGGDLNFFSRGQMVPPFEEATFALQAGQTSGVVETPFGYHIVKLTDRREPRTIPLAEVAPRIGQFLTMQQQQEQTEAFLNRLKARSKIEILI